MPRLICPICRSPLLSQPKLWRCESGHSFDLAREGYLNLLPVQHKNSRNPGDQPAMLAARREFLVAGHYLPLRDAVLAVIRPLGAGSLLDVGCGEGYYTSAFAAVAGETTGLDIAKPAIQLAARRYRDIGWIVGSGASLPLADASVDLVTTLFTPLHVAQMQRVLKPGGHVLVVTPASGHLHALRQGLFEEVREHEPDKFIAEFDGLFALQDRRELRYPLHLTQVALKQLLLMTPYVWKARPALRAALESRQHLVTEAAFSLMLFRRL